MMKYIIFELASIASFVLILIFYRQLEKQPQIELVFTILFLILFTLIILIIPAIALLSIRDKITPNAFLNSVRTPVKLKRNTTAIIAVIVALDWVFYLLSIKYNNTPLLYFSYVFAPLAVLIVSIKSWKSYHISLKAYLIFWGLIAITFIIILFIFKSLLLIPFLI